MTVKSAKRSGRRSLAWAREEALIDRTRTLYPDRFARVRGAIGEVADGIDPDHLAALIVDLVEQRLTVAV